MDKDLLLESFGQHLTKLRKERDLSIHQLAHACDLEYSHLQRIEKGKVNIAFTTLMSIAQGLEIHPEELFKKFYLPQ